MSDTYQLKKTDSANESVYSVQSTITSIKSKSSKILSSLRHSKSKKTETDSATTVATVHPTLPDAANPKRRSSELSVTSQTTSQSAGHQPQTDRQRRVNATATYFSLRS